MIFTDPRTIYSLSLILPYAISMPLRTVSFRLTEVQQPDRTFVINEAVSQYLPLHKYHRSLLEEGIREDDAGDIIDHEILMATLAGRPE